MTPSRGIRVPKGTRRAWIDQNQGRYICACGCGEPIPLRPEHFNVGVPRWRHGHNPGPGKRELEAVSCACGCGQLTRPGNRYVNGHNGRGQPRPPHVVEAVRRSKIGARNPQYGKRPPNFKGRVLHASGYVMVHAPSHPFADGHRRVMEHRLVLERHLRETNPESEWLVEIDGELYLRPDIDVHHVDGDRANNVVENLRPMTKADHARLHGNLSRARRAA